MPVVLASWNVHGWVGADGRRDPLRALDAICRMGADVVALQEVEDTDWIPAARAAGYRTTRAATVGTTFGNALLARVPLTNVRRVDLSVIGREPRCAIDSSLCLASGPLRVVCAHFGLRASERRRQAARLARHLEADDLGLPLALLGDLNDWTARGRQLTPLSDAVGPLSRVPTFPSRRPLFPLDRVASQTPGWVAKVEAVGCPEVRLASDHLPLRVELSATGEDTASRRR